MKLCILCIFLQETKYIIFLRSIVFLTLSQWLCASDKQLCESIYYNLTFIKYPEKVLNINLRKYF